MFVRVAAYPVKLEIIRILAIETRNARKNIVPVLINCRDRRASITSRVDLERLRRDRQSLIGINLNIFRMRHRNQLDLVDEQRLLELVRYAQLVIPISLA